MNQSEITQLVKKHLAGLPFEVQVVEDGVRQEGDWWYVTVQAREEPARQWRYYEILADIENDIAGDNHEKVLLVPVTWSEPAERTA